jgi:stringent starvation protein B
LKPRRPYLLRALHEWITDSGETPHIVVDAAAEEIGRASCRERV